MSVQLLLVLLVFYAIVIMSALTLLMMLLVRRAAKSRLRFFSIFTALPRPMVQSIDVSGIDKFWLDATALLSVT